MVLSAIIILLTIFYGFLIQYYWRAWISIPDFQITNTTPQTNISVIVPARNEESNIGRLLDSLDRQSYPRWLFNVLVVDDNSTDSTAQIVRQSRAVLMQLDGNILSSHKKKAIETGIQAATGDLIVTTDADCTAERDWLNAIAQFKEEKNPVFIAAPVRLSYNSSTLEIFQALDFMALQGITAAAVHKQMHSMCNGANLAYERRSFYEVNGFSGIDKIASGDDMLLMHKIKEKYPDRVLYLKSKEAIVTSQPMKTWKEFYNQRIRWASKVFYYKDRSVFWVLALVYLFNLSFLALLVAGFFNYCYWIGLLGLWLVKTMIEFPFVSAIARFYEYSALMRYFFFFQPLHIAYTIIAGLLGQIGKYEWKGRRVK